MSASDIQSTLLSYLGQQSLAHMALVFAVLVAVFTFATGFDKKLSRLRAIVSYLGVVLLLLTVAAYAVGRSVFYGALAWKAILTDPTLCPAASPITLAKYVSCINSAYYPSDPLVRLVVEPILSNYRNFAGFGILISFFLALLGTVAIFVIARSPERPSEDNKTPKQRSK